MHSDFSRSMGREQLHSVLCNIVQGMVTSKAGKELGWILSSRLWFGGRAANVQHKTVAEATLRNISRKVFVNSIFGQEGEEDDCGKLARSSS